jgi:hypothetical protein
LNGVQNRRGAVVGVVVYGVAGSGLVLPLALSLVRVSEGRGAALNGAGSPGGARSARYVRGTATVERRSGRAVEPQSQSPPEQTPQDSHVPGLRKVALASVAALAVVLPLAAATDGPAEHPGHSGHSGHSGLGAPHARTTTVHGTGLLPRSGDGI